MEPGNEQHSMNYDDCYQKTWGQNYSVQPFRAMRYHCVKKTLNDLQKENLPLKKALDVGCGIGDIVRFISGLRKGIEVNGIDLSQEAVELAKKSSPDIAFYVSDIASFNPDKSYDLVTAIDVVEHIKDDIAALQKINHLLSENGILLLSLPHNMKYWTKNDEVGGHYRRYGKKEIIKKLGDTGFDIVRIKTYGFPFPVLYLYLKNWLNKSQSFNENKLADNPGFLKKAVSKILKWIFCYCELNAGQGLHLLVTAKKARHG